LSDLSGRANAGAYRRGRHEAANVVAYRLDHHESLVQEEVRDAPDDQEEDLQRVRGNRDDQEEARDNRGDQEEEARDNRGDQEEEVLVDQDGQEDRDNQDGQEEEVLVDQAEDLQAHAGQGECPEEPRD